MKRTPARSSFKNNLGQANHFLVTGHVALHTLANSDVTQAPQELHTTWNPKDRSASIERTRIFLSQSFLGWAVDSLDMYLSLLRSKPDFLRNAVLKDAMNAAGRSVYTKMLIVADHYDIDPITRALMDVLVTWRNTVFHGLADNKLLDESCIVLQTCKKEISEQYRGLEVESLKAKAENAGVLTFKETASLIHATHDFVEKVDAAVLSALDVMEFCKETVLDSLCDNAVLKEKYYRLPPDKRARVLQNWIENELRVTGIPTEALIPMLGVSGPDLREHAALRARTPASDEIVAECAAGETQGISES